MVKDRVVIAELHVIRFDHLPLTLRAEDFTRLENLGDEHRPLALRRRRQEVQVLPDRAANGAWNADVVLDTRPAARHRSLDELLDGCAAFRPQVTDVAFLAELEMSGSVSDDEAA